MNDVATFALVQWAESLKGEELQKLPKVVREAVICEQARMAKYWQEDKRDQEIVKRFPEGAAFKDQHGRKCTVSKHRIDRGGHGVDAMIARVGMGYFHSSELAKYKPGIER